MCECKCGNIVSMDRQERNIFVCPACDISPLKLKLIKEVDEIQNIEDVKDLFKQVLDRIF